MQTAEMNITGTDAGDTLTGDQNDNVIMGLSGDDVIDGLEGNDVIVGGRGFDNIQGGAGNDEIYAEDMSSGSSSDPVEAPTVATIDIFGGEGNDTITGGKPLTTFSIFNPIPEICGDAGNDLIRGGVGGDVEYLYGGEGTDTVIGSGGGANSIGFSYGDAGNDVVVGGIDTGSENLYGGEGNDTVIGAESSATERLSYFGDAGNDVLMGGIGQALDASSSVSLGGTGFYGGEGNDTIAGGGVLSGGDGNDVLRVMGVEQGTKTSLGGGDGKDVLIGSDKSVDTFGFFANFNDPNPTPPDNPDIIRNFEVGQDVIDVTLLNSAGISGEIELGGTPLTFIGDAAFSATEGVEEFRFADGRVEVDNNSDGVADHAIEVRGVETLTESDFLF
jgi:Ca2+-binding RTX toxin-like protein